MKHYEALRLQDNNDDRELILVPLNSKTNEHVEIWNDDFELLMRLGLSRAWHRVRGGYVAAVAHLAKGSLIGVARVLLDAQPGQNVVHLDGNTLNLKRENLKLVNGGWSRRRDRDFITPTSRKRKTKEK